MRLTAMPVTSFNTAPPTRPVQRRSTVSAPAMAPRFSGDFGDAYGLAMKIVGGVILGGGLLIGGLIGFGMRGCATTSQPAPQPTQQAPQK